MLRAGYVARRMDRATWLKEWAELCSSLAGEVRLDYVQLGFQSRSWAARACKIDRHGRIKGMTVESWVLGDTAGHRWKNRSLRDSWAWPEELRDLENCGRVRNGCVAAGFEVVELWPRIGARVEGILRLEFVGILQVRLKGLEVKV
ncbi:hypothetical protein PRUPE_5G036000 [Prunus persica]|uniref:Uncharacterized protein n=1 Tax=Prunus persica TaxID=3760 RepID=A0A251P6N1_PRUPE|nr:hypothetical protein PRUPE_5G036000 [Prunus persica]